jgi:hypothetical protein
MYEKYRSENMKKILWDRLPPQLKISQAVSIGLFTCTPQHLSYMCKCGIVPAIRRGKLWIFNTAELKRYYAIDDLKG